MTVYTTIFGDRARDHLRPPPPGCEAKYVCFSDCLDAAEGWEIRSVPRPEESPVLSARLCKARPDLWLGPEETTIWLDASCALLQPAAAILEVAETYKAPVVGFLHKRRMAVVTEAEVVMRGRLADPDAVRRQMIAYRKDGFAVDQARVTTTGMLVRTPAAAAFGRAWEVELRTRTWRDQLSVDYCGWKTGTAIGWLPGTYLENPFMYYYRHVGRER